MVTVEVFKIDQLLKLRVGISRHEPSREEWRNIARQAMEERDPQKAIELAQKAAEKFDEEQRAQKRKREV